MKKILIAISIAAIPLLWSCRTDKKQPGQIESSLIQVKEETARQNDSLDNEADYRAASEARLFENDRDLELLRSSPPVPSSKPKKANSESDKEMLRVYRHRIDSLEKKNSELRSRLKQYHDSDKSRWNQFKKEFSSDLDQLRQSLKSIGTNAPENDSKN